MLYASSTVGIEALKFGKPVIYADFGDFLNSDPLFNFNAFKWTCKTQQNLCDIINEISALDQTTYQEKQKQGCLYAEDYFHPATNASMKVFL